MYLLNLPDELLIIIIRKTLLSSAPLIARTNQEFQHIMATRFPRRVSMFKKFMIGIKYVSDSAKYIMDTSWSIVKSSYPRVPDDEGELTDYTKRAISK